MITKYFENTFLIAFLLFLIKWFFFFNTNFEIDVTTKIIFEIPDWQYFTLISNLSNLNFNPSYDPDVLSLKYIALPIYSILYHSLFFNFFGIYGFIIIEFFIILLFFQILIHFLMKLGVNKVEAIALTLFLFCIPSILDYFQLLEIQYIGSIKQLYNLRIPRPSISHLYLFLFFLILISCKKNTQFKLAQLVSIGSIFALMWGSFYYNFIISGITFIMYYFYITYRSNQKIFKYIKDVLTVSIFFVLFSIPIIFILLNSETDYLTRVGLIKLDFSKKEIILKHFLKMLLNIKFLVVFIAITFLYFFLKIKKIYKKEGLDLLYIIFLSSFFAPLIFIIISPTISEIYHFTNMIISLSFFVLLIFLFLTLLTLKKTISWTRYIFKLSILILLVFYSIFNYSISKNNYLKAEKLNIDQLIKEIDKININRDSSILTFDTMVQTYLILNNYKNLTIVAGINTPLNDEGYENKIINIFKFLNLEAINFNNFIKNEKHGWRFINKNIAQTFYMKYQANKLTTYKNSMDFTPDELKYISKSSPLHSQQLIIPSFEIERLTDKFLNFSNYQKISPELIIINVNTNFTKNLSIDEQLYCSKNINNTFKIYLIKKYC